MGHQSRQRRLLLFIFTLVALLLVGQTLLSSRRWLGEPFPGFFVYPNLTVAPYNVPGWSGAGAGMAPLDRILRVDGEKLNDRSELYARVRNRPAGSMNHYQVLRGSRLYEFKVPSQILAVRDWFLSFGIYLVVGLAFLATGVLPFLFRASSPVALPMCFMVLSVFLWFVTTFDFLTEGQLPKEVRIFALCLTPGAAIHLALLLHPHNRQSMRYRFGVGSVYGIGVAIAVLNAVNHFGPAGVWRLTHYASYAYVVIGALAFLVIAAAASRLTDSDLERSRLRVMLIGALGGFLLPALMVLLAGPLELPISFNLALVPTVFFPVSVAYALLKYNLFDLGNVFKAALSRVALMALLIAIYAVVALTVAPLAGESLKDPLVLVLFSIVIVVLFNPLLRTLEAMVDRFVYRRKYDPAAVRADVSLFLRTLDDSTAVAEGFVERVARCFGMNTAALLYRSKDAGQPVVVAEATVKHFLNNSGGELLKLWRSGDYRGISRDEVATSPAFSDLREGWLQAIDELKAELLLPLVYERKVRGVACFGAKGSGLEYSAADYRLLETLTEQLALSLENGRLYQESVSARNEAENTNRRLIEMDRMKKDFVANICHELRTPVSTIIGFAEILRDPDFQGDRRDMLDRLVRNGQELSGLMDSLMDYSRMETHGGASQLEVVKLKEVLAGLQIMTQRLIRARPIEFGLHIESAVETIESDAQKLQQILLQLLTNAIKFTEKGRIDLSLREWRRNNDEFLEIAVADTGIGIKAEDQKLIFDDFRQLDGSSTRRYGGTGLGLGLCRKFANALGGEIHVSSQIGVGSVFSLLLPIRPAQPAMGLFATAGAQPMLQ